MKILCQNEYNNVKYETGPQMTSITTYGSGNTMQINFNVSPIMGWDSINGDYVKGDCAE